MRNKVLRTTLNELGVLYLLPWGTTKERKMLTVFFFFNLTRNSRTEPINKRHIMKATTTINSTNR